MKDIIIGLLIPFIGTTLGASCALFLKNELKSVIQKVLLGFASGIMVAASVWSLIIPSIEMSMHMKKFAFIPAAVGVIVGMLFLLLMDHVIPHLHLNTDEPEGIKTNFKKTAMLIFAVTLHNIPEGMAVGVVFAGVLSQSAHITLSSAIALSLGIAIQNFPEGAIVSLPLRSEGNGRGKAFLYGTLSGVVEPVAAALTIVFADAMILILPYLLAFAAGAMLYVVVEELIPEASTGKHSNIGTIGFCIGFVIMMILDVALG
ncbi:MAG: ZIP family metal transporter [Lachnospiraceae bacterium]|nr:ZIP family metal transporter [Lachnospiraceae bacterium]